jgi:hypothetical protein
MKKYPENFQNTAPISTREDPIKKNRPGLRFVLLSLLLVLIAGLIVVFSLLPQQQQPSHPLTSNANSPYGFTVLTIFRKQTVADLQQLQVNWIRYQLDWKTIEPQPGHYDWRQLDAAVSLANASGIHMTFPIQQAPSWAQSQVCAGRHLFPGAQQMADFASVLARRYNGNNGHGYIDSYEIGNEEFDSLWTGNWDQSIACRQPSFYGPVLKAGYQAVKAASPHALVGMGGMWWVNTPHIQDYMRWLYQNKYGSYFDFANFHYYICNDDPAYSMGDRPSFDVEWQTIHEVMQQYNDGKKPIWVTETGWNTSGVYQDPRCIVTPQLQAQYLLYTAQESMNSHVIQHIFWYTIDRENDGMSITQPEGNLPSFTILQSFIAKHPSWKS